KKSEKSQKLVVGLALAVVGLAVLGVAAFFILSGKKEEPKGPMAKGPNIPQVPPGGDKGTNPGGGGTTNPGGTDTTNPMGDPTMGDPKMGDPKMGDPGMGAPKGGENSPPVGDPPSESNLVELTNLLPNGPPSRDPEHVAHYFFRDIFGPLREAAFNKNGFIDAQFRQRLGFSVLDVYALIPARRV